MDLIVNHSSGFFSCNSVALRCLVDFYNEHKTLPNNFIRSGQYHGYKSRDIDMSKLLFTPKLDTNPYHLDSVSITKEAREDQFSDYRNLNYDAITPLINKYFNPSDLILDRVSELISTHNIDVDNTCAVFYRGNDKASETPIASYGSFVEKAKQRQLLDENITFLVQTDENEFLTEFYNSFPNITTHFTELDRIDKSSSCVFFNIPDERREKHAIDYLAAILVLAKCRYVITHSGNGGMWTVLYRGNANNVDQILNNEWL